MCWSLIFSLRTYVCIFAIIISYKLHLVGLKNLYSGKHKFNSWRTKVKRTIHLKGEMKDRSIDGTICI